MLGKSSDSGTHALGGGATALTVNEGGTAMLSGYGGDQISDAQNLELAGGVFDLNGMNERVGWLTGHGTITNSGGAAVLTLGGPANTSGALYVAGGTLSLPAGTVSVAGTWNNQFGIAGGSTFELNGGAFNAGLYFAVGNGVDSGTASMVARSGSLNMSGGEFLVGFKGPAEVTISDSASMSLNWYSFGNNDSASWFNGGLIALQNFHSRGSAPTAFYFNGTTFQAKGNDAAFLPVKAGITANVTTNGVWIDTRSYNITLEVPFQHDPALGGLADGGLTKKAGTGIMTLAGANTYTGNTTISEGTLALAASGSIANSRTISIAANAKLDVSATTFTVDANQTLEGTGMVIGAVANDGTLATGTGIGTLTFATAPALNSGGKVRVQLDRMNPQTSDQFVVSSGTLAFGGTPRRHQHRTGPATQRHLPVV